MVRSRLLVFTFGLPLTLHLVKSGDVWFPSDDETCGSYNCLPNNTKVRFAGDCEGEKNGCEDYCCNVPGYGSCMAKNSYKMGNGVCDQKTYGYQNPTNGDECGFDYGECCQCSCQSGACMRPEHNFQCFDPRYDDCNAFRVGCFKQEDVEDVFSLELTWNLGMTVEVCYLECEKIASCSYFGLIRGKECWLTYNNHTGIRMYDDDPEGCKTPCSGEIRDDGGKDMCGGLQHMEVFKTDGIDGVRVGCFDTPEFVVHSWEAYPSRETPSSNAGGGWGAGGNVATDKEFKTDDSFMDEDMNVQKCNLLCKWSEEPCHYFALSGGEYCSLSGTAKHMSSVSNDDSACNMRCEGRHTDTCGASGKAEVFDMDGIREELVGCFHDGDFDKEDNVLLRFDAEGMAIEMCTTSCINQFGRDDCQFIGLRSGNRCFRIVDSLDDKSTDDTICDISCVGDSSNTCGGDKMLEIFELIQL